MGTNPLIERLISTQNKSGSIPTAPHGMKNLRGSLLRIPFGLEPGISRISSSGSVIDGLAAFSSLLGGLGLLGSIVNAVISEGARNAGVSGEPDRETSTAVARSVDEEKLKNALGPNQTLIMGLHPFDAEDSA